MQVDKILNMHAENPVMPVGINNMPLDNFRVTRLFVSDIFAKEWSTNEIR